MKKLAILSSGGDCQGMNACIKSFTNTCKANDITPIGIIRGYQGLIENKFIELDNDMVEPIAILGGSILKVSRSKEFMTTIGVDKAVENLKNNGIEGLVILGGNGSYKGSLELVKRGVRVINVPATIDNDLFYTEKTLGFDTAVNKAVQTIDDIRQTITANDRGLVVEVMGRDCGDIALYTAISCSAHSLATVELDSSIRKILNDVKICMAQGVMTPLVVISESMPFSVIDVKNAMMEELGIEVRTSDLGYVQRGGNPSMLDRVFGMQYGVTAVKLLQDGKDNLALGIMGENVFSMPIIDAINAKQNFNFSLYHKLRDLYNLDR